MDDGRGLERAVAVPLHQAEHPGEVIAVQQIELAVVGEVAGDDVARVARDRVGVFGSSEVAGAVVEVDVTHRRRCRSRRSLEWYRH